MQSHIKLENVCLDYILKTGSMSLRKLLVHIVQTILRQPTDNKAFNTGFRALNNINLELKQGDKLGILGRNGAGKSTLLRVLADIYKPHLGKVELHGTTSCLFDIALGLDLEATGIENIITMCILKGMKKSDAYKIIDDVEEFSELGEFINNPVRMYSAGMRMKLAFGVATAGHPDILLVDEVIGVGDAKFMQKAINRVEKLMHDSNILVLTSHSNAVIKQFCNKAIVLEQGEIIYSGDVNSAVDFYDDLLFHQDQTKNKSKSNSTELEPEIV